MTNFQLRLRAVIYHKSVRAKNEIRDMALMARREINMQAERHIHEMRISRSIWQYQQQQNHNHQPKGNPK